MSYKLMPMVAILALAAASPTRAAENEQTVELKDGTTLIVQTNGRMRHIDQRGHAVLMHEGTVMEARDGSHYMMKNSAIWKQLYEKGTLNPKQ